MLRGWESEELSDLLQRTRDGDDDAFDVLYRQVAPLARRTAYRIVRDAHVADDLVQETFYIVVRAVRGGRGPQGSVVGYILLTTKRLAYRHCTMLKRTVAVDDPTTWEQYLGDTAHPAAETDNVAAALASLPPRWRDILWLIEVDRYSPAELAAPMRMTPSAVSSLATRARRALRTAYMTARYEAGAA